MARVDKISPLQSIPEYYSDLTTNMDRNLITGQLARITNDEAVKESIKNLVLTSLNERPYQPTVGSRIRESLFEPIDDPLTIDNIRQSIIDCIKNNEPRAVDVVVQLNSNLDQNGYDVQIHFSLQNLTAVFLTEFFLQRIR